MKRIAFVVKVKCEVDVEDFGNGFLHAVGVAKEIVNHTLNGTKIGEVQTHVVDLGTGYEIEGGDHA